MFRHSEKTKKYFPVDKAELFKKVFLSKMFPHHVKSLSQPHSHRRREREEANLQPLPSLSHSFGGQTERPNERTPSFSPSPFPLFLHAKVNYMEKRSESVRPDGREDEEGHTFFFPFWDGVGHGFSLTKRKNLILRKHFIILQFTDKNLIV